MSSQEDEQQRNKYGHCSVCRSTEFLSCARTAVRILQQQQQQQQQQEESCGYLLGVNAASLSLHNKDDGDYEEESEARQVQDDAVVLLSRMDDVLGSLSSLVRQRSHTNDPTARIQTQMSHFQEHAQELSALLTTLLECTSSSDNSKQRRRHYEVVATCCKTLAEQRVETFKQLMQIRSKVVVQESHRKRLLLNPTANLTNKPDAPASRIGGPRVSGTLSQFHTPLFTTTTNSTTPLHNIDKRNTSQSTYFNNTAATTGGGGYGGGTVGYGGGGFASADATTGIRRRVAAAGGGGANMSSNANGNFYQSVVLTNEEEEDGSSSARVMQHQIQQNRVTRDSKVRLDSARLIEKSLVEMTHMFTKMSTLLSTQNETLLKIEDDIEAAHDDISSGQEEIIKLYNITKGNRSLILKIFGILLFFIILLRFY